MKIDLDGHDIDEIRRYKKFYADKIPYKNGGDCKINIQRDSISINAGGYSGMADGCPESPMLYDWIQDNIKGLSIKQCHALYWCIEDYESYSSFNKLLIQNGAILDDLTYQLKRSELIYLIGFLYKNKTNVEIINVNPNSFGRDSALIITPEIYKELGEYCISNNKNKEFHRVVEIILKNSDNNKSIHYIYEHDSIRIMFNSRKGDDRYNKL